MFHKLTMHNVLNNPCLMFQDEMSDTKSCQDCPPVTKARKKKKQLKCSACTEFENLDKSLGPREVAYVRNALAHGYQSFKKVKESAFETNSDRYVNRKRGEVASRLIQWRKCRDLDNVPVGCARYLLQCEEFCGLAANLQILEFARKLLSRHRTSCDDTCVDLIHAGDQLNDDAITSLALFDAASTSMDNLAPAWALDSSSVGLHMPSSPRTGLVSNYQSVDDLFQSQETLVERAIEEDFISGALGTALLGSSIPLEVCKMLVRTNVKTTYTFNQILQHWSVKRRIDHEAISELCFLLNRYQPQILYTGPNKLPLCAKTLLKIDHEKLKADCPTRTVRPAKDALDPRKPTLVPVKKPPGPLAEAARDGEYMHFGLEKALLGKSPGLVNRWEYIATLRRIHAVFPTLLPREFVELTLPQIGEENHTDTLINHMFAHMNLTSDDGKKPEVNI
jgi:hypothetical protein